MQRYYLGKLFVWNKLNSSFSFLSDSAGKKNGATVVLGIDEKWPVLFG